MCQAHLVRLTLRNDLLELAQTCGHHSRRPWLPPTTTNTHKTLTPCCLTAHVSCSVSTRMQCANGYMVSERTLSEPMVCAFPDVRSAVTFALQCSIEMLHLPW